MKDRLLKFLNREQLSSARFAEIIGVQPSSISHILSGRNKPGFDFIQKILTGYPSINAEWLIIGKGNMLKSDTIQGDLFSGELNAPTGPTGSVDETAAAAGKDDNNEIIENPGNAFTNVTGSSENQDYISKSRDHGKVTTVNKDKVIQKIVIFYSDKSFTEYSPESS